MLSRERSISNRAASQALRSTQGDGCRATQS